MRHAVPDVSHILGGAVLVLAFALLTRRHGATLIGIVAAQSGVVAIAAAWQALAQSSATLAGLALAVLLAGVGAVPWLLRRCVAPDPDSLPSAKAALAGAALLAVLALLATAPTRLPGLSSVREDLALAVAVVLVALLALVARRGVLSPLLGLHALANGVALMAVAVGAALPELAAVVALFGFVAIAVAVRPAPGDAL